MQNHGPTNLRVAAWGRKRTFDYSGIPKGIRAPVTALGQAVRSLFRPAFDETPLEIPCETLTRSFRDALPDTFPDDSPDDFVV